MEGWSVWRDVVYRGSECMEGWSVWWEGMYGGM